MEATSDAINYRLNDILKILAIQPHDNHLKTATNNSTKQGTRISQVVPSFNVKSSYEKLKMIEEDTYLKLNQRKNKTTIPYTWDYQRVSNTEMLPINHKLQTQKHQITRNKSLQQLLIGLKSKTRTEIKLPQIEGTRIHSINPHNSSPIQGYDVKQNTWDIRNVESDKNQLIDHKALRGDYINRNSTCMLPFKSKTQPERHLSNNLNRNLKEPTLITQLYSMSSLRLDNRQDMAANDHVRHHIKRQQQWIRSDQVKNWRKSPLSRVKKQTYPNSSSSGQKSDVISGNSDESLHTASSSETQQIIDFEYDEERKEAIEKCLKWMNDLPTKFSGLHILDPAKS